MTKLPHILDIATVAQSRLFQIENVRLRFANGAETDYERITAGDCYGGAVMVVPVAANGAFLLVREYAVGLERYELGPPKGLIERGESVEQAANRELMEEIGMAARRFRRLSPLALAPGFLNFTCEVLLATELYPASLPGDEPEALEVIALAPDALETAIADASISEARSIAALYLARSCLAAAASIPAVVPMAR
ncbi:ADP compounds hydrolase NudE [Alkalilimnicola ehrlichii]|uniref:ADP compounds hydrolase NudE n=1 Tax=Alkalilimnicola ehrlichii TaxID=351052 RepID=A0A3E0X151_9GAMM|nr:ADP compounds hydrolase NudE [Alkalilimnicola ehrlichii]RFA30816.1 ADP compounds hydrolase NudE [Alkalilimnicola ehrlichii]RFA38395.1 ADP compounds hydrolase NudE [Alkalilimnicola ehrlichii]